MIENKGSGTCCGEPDHAARTASASETACCTPSRGGMKAKDASICCGPVVESPRASGTRAEKRRLEIDFMYLDLSVCGRCRDTGAALDEAIDEVARVLETTGVEVALNKIHVTNEEQAAALGFVVSPTIRVSGRDIQMNFRESLCESCSTLCECEGGVSCREWEYQARWYPAPPKALIIEAILKEVYGGAGEERENPRIGEQVPDNLKRFFSGLHKQEAAGRSRKLTNDTRRRIVPE